MKISDKDDGFYIYKQDICLLSGLGQCIIVI